MFYRWPAEWEKQYGVLLAWPHEKTDWAPRLFQVRRTFLELARHISCFEKILVVGPNVEEIRRELISAEINSDLFTLIASPTNDTWARDFGPVTVLENGNAVLFDFTFNGWGGKYPGSLDNQITEKLYEKGLFPKATRQHIPMVLEGGSIESDGNGTLLTTSQCLLNPNRNPEMKRKDIENRLAALLGIENFLWLNEGFLIGDDTDAHVDILARFCTEDTIAYTTCDEKGDMHFEPLRKMENELKGFKRRNGEPYRLIPLPIPRPQYNEKGERLAASYANFLIINQAVLVPIYQDEKDRTALKRLGQAFPGREIIGIDCRELIRQGGSLHCMTMQFPAGVTR
jgi:agmatine deiminase